MTAVRLVPAVLTLLRTGEQIAFYTAGWSEQAETTGSVRVMANGRRRTVTRPGGASTLGFTARWVSPDTVRTLKAWAGERVLIRDFKGRKHAGVFFTVEVIDLSAEPGVHDVKLQLASVSFTEAV